MIIKVKDARELRKMLKEKFGKETVKKAKIKIRSSNFSDNIFVSSDLILMTSIGSDGSRYVTNEEVDKKTKELLDYAIKNVFKEM
jgi:hypothetical protein